MSVNVPILDAERKTLSWLQRVDQTMITSSALRECSCHARCVCVCAFNCTEIEGTDDDQEDN